MRGTTLSDRHGVALTLPNGTLDNPSLRFGGARSGLSRTDLGDLAVSVKKFLALGVSDAGLLIRSNSGSLAAPAARVTPLMLDRSNATVGNGDETALEIQEAGAPVGRLALYRETETRRSWRFYGFDAGLNATPILDLGGDGTVRVPGSLVVETNTNLGNTTVEGALAVTGDTTFSQSITVEGDIVVTAPDGLTPPLGIGGPGVSGGLISLYPTASLQGLVQGGTIPHAINLTNAAPNASPTAFARLGMAVGGAGYLGGANSLSLYTTGAAAGDLVLGTANLARLTIAAAGGITIPGAVSLGSTLGVTGLLTATGGLTTPVSATIGGTLGVTGLLTATGGLTTPVNAVIGGTLGVTGLSTLGAINGTSLNVGTGVIASGPITVTGTATISGNLTASAISGTSLNASGGTITGGALSATTGTFSGNISAAGISGSSLNVGGGTVTAGTLTLSAGITASSVSAGNFTGGLFTTGFVVGNYFNGGNTAQGDVRASVFRAGTFEGGAHTGASVAVSGGISGGALTGTSLTVGNGSITAGSMGLTGSGTTLSTPNGAISCYAITATSPGWSLTTTGSLSVGNGVTATGPISGSAITASGHLKCQTFEVTGTTIYGGGSSATCAAFAYMVFNGTGYKVPLFN